MAAFLAEDTTSAGSIPYLLYLLHFDAYGIDNHFVVKGTPINYPDGPQRTFEVIEDKNFLGNVAKLAQKLTGTQMELLMKLLKEQPLNANGLAATGIVVRVSGTTLKDGLGFMAEVTEFK